MERPKILPHEEHKRLTERGSGSLQPDGSAPLVEALATVAWETLNHDNDPHDGQIHNATNWRILCGRISRVLKKHGKHAAPAALKEPANDKFTDAGSKDVVCFRCLKNPCECPHRAEPPLRTCTHGFLADRCLICKALSSPNDKAQERREGKL